MRFAGSTSSASVGGGGFTSSNRPLSTRTPITGLSGAADLLIGVVATDADDLYHVAGLVLAVPGVQRTTMSVAMHEVVPYRTRPLLEQLARRQ